MKIPPYRPKSWQRLVQRFGSTTLGLWLLPRALPHLDAFFLRLTGGRQTHSSITSGAPIFMLTTTGAKSGRPRTTPVVGVVMDSRIILVASNWGQAAHPAWYYNLCVHPEAVLMLAGSSGRFIAHEAVEAERTDLWPVLENYYLGFRTYRLRAKNRPIPILVLEEKDGCKAAI